MGNSFKIQKSGTSKETARSLGALILILGIVIAFLIHPLWGGLMVLFGFILLLAGFTASE